KLFRSYQSRGAFCNAPFELLIQEFQLTGLAMQFDKNIDLGFQYLRYDRDRNIIYRPTLVSLNTIRIREMNGGDEDDGSFLEPRVLADHFRQLEAIDVRHAHIHQNNSWVGLEQEFQCLLGRAGFEQILTEISQYDLIAEQLGGLIVDHE